MTIAWVVGSNGLLGTALCRTLHRAGVSLFTPAERFRWDCEPDLIAQLEAAVKAFAAFSGAEDEWQIYWAAGLGTMSSAETELAVETRALTTLLGYIASEPRLIEVRGCFAFASSAGAIYAGAKDGIISENTFPAPTTAYAHEKLRQEKLVSEFVRDNCKVAALLARISTLYGPGQTTGKQQGLIAMIARRILQNQPIQIYVPFDTIRDYILSDDAAAAIVAALNTTNGKHGVFTKIIASERPTTIAEIISVFKRIARRTPRIVTSTSKLSSLYARRTQFHSITVIPNAQLPRTSLYVGISQVMAAERIAFTRSSKMTTY